MNGEEHYTDVGNARRLVRMFGAELRYVSPWKAWLVWDGSRWRRDHSGVVVERAKQVAGELWEEARREASDERSKARKWALQSEGAGRIKAMVELASTEPGIPVLPEELDANPWLLNVKNGTLDLRRGVIRPAQPGDLLTKQAAAEYDLEAEAPRWDVFLEQILPDPDVREFMRRWAGYCLTGDVSEHKVVFAHGIGANGKSTLLNTLAHVMGSYASQAAPDLLMRHRDEQHPAGSADLQGARLVLASETGQNRHLDEALLKRLTGGDRVRARQMYGQFFEFEPTHKFVIATNHRPAISGTDHGIWRRIRLVPFTVTIPDEDQDRRLEDKLLAEADGVLVWAAQGCLAWRSEGLSEPFAIQAATAGYRADMDTLGAYISDCCYLVDGVSAQAGQLYAAYERWAEAMGEKVMTAAAFGRALGERGLVKKKSGKVFWEGIGLKVDDNCPAGDRESAGERG